MNTRRTALMMMAMAAGGVLCVPTSAAAATRNTFGALVPSTFVEADGSANIPESGVQSATVPCAAGTAAVSTGGLTTVPGGGSGGLTSITPGPDYANGVATGRADRGDTSGLIIAQATCAPTVQFAGTTVAKREQNVHSATGEWTQTVTCPAGMRAFGGGGYFRASNGATSKDNFLMSADSLTTNGRSWTVSALDRTFTDTLVVTTRCALQSSSTRLVEEIYPIVPEPGSTVGKVNGYAHCPAGFLPISGGAQVTQDGSPSAARPGLIGSLSVRNGQIGWWASGLSGGSNARLHVIALCG